MAQLNEADLEDVLLELFDGGEAHEYLEQDSTAESFRSAGVLTTDRGVVVTLADGSRFALTIQEMRR